VATLFEPAVDRQGEILKPYVPRLLIEWVHETPEKQYRAVDGTLAFVDISGFTALTERLSRKGKIGAELMRDTLDGVFRALLDEAYDWGAGLLKWGGDALLLLFDGPGHPQRAARAMWELQRTIDRVGRLRVGGGTVTLRMSIGIATGEIDFFTAGSVHRELLVAGPVATETVTIEAVADAGEIGISRRLAALLDPTCVGPDREGYPLLTSPPEVERQRAPDVGAVSGLQVARCIPIAAREHVLLERSEPEHRTITAAFIDLMDTDMLIERLGPDAFAEALDERIRMIEEAALQHEVPFYETDIGKGSIKALLTAGAPSSTGHDEEQMLRTLREVLDRDGVIPMRVGVNTGKVFTGDFGPPYRRAYRVFGDAINTAARVMSRADAGQILSTEVVLERSRTTFHTTPIEPFKAKGKSELVRASIVGPIAGRRGDREAQTTLIGRDAELAALLAVIEDARQGRGWVVEVSGAPGVGRSRLVQELVERCRDLRVLQTRCEEYEASTPYFAFRALMRSSLGVGMSDDAAAVERQLREVVARVDPALEPWLPLLGVLFGLDLEATPEIQSLDERFLRPKIFEVTQRFLVEMLGGTSTVFAIEDAHYMDEASSDLLRRLAAASMSYRFVIVLTHADTSTVWAPLDDGARSLAMTLVPLTERQAAEIVALATDDAPLPPHAVEEIARRSAGNVLFLFELIDMARATGTTDALPDSVEAVIAADIDRLSPSDRTVLRYASVLGASFDRRILTRALQGDLELDNHVWERLRGLVNGDTSGEMRFRNTLVRDAAYEGLPFRRRRQLHARVAEAFETDATGEEHVSTLALHFFEAQQPDKAWQYCRLAGDRAATVAANVEAARFYERALTAARRIRGLAPSERADVWISLGGVRDKAGLVDASFAALARATSLLADDPVAQAQVYAKRALARVHGADYGAALRETAAGLRRVSSLESKAAVAARAELLALRAETRWHQGRGREAIEIANRAIVDAKRVDDLHALAIAYSALDGSYQMIGEPEKAVYEVKAAEIWAKLGQMRSLGIAELNIGVQAFADGDWSGAVDWYTRAQADCLRAGDRATAAVAAGNLGEVLVSQGRLDEAEMVLTDARRALRAAGYTPHALFAELQLAKIALDRGRPDDAVPALQAIVAEASTVGHPIMVLEAVVQYAHALVVAGDPAAGLAALDDGVASAGEVVELLSVPVGRARGEALAALGRLDEADESLDAALPGAIRQGLLNEQLLIRRLRCDVTRRRGEEAPPEELQEIDRLLQLLGVAG
jgi:class 3 adenylate cyclase/tetratricopeptide (TPR) repeat protein